MAKQSVLTGIVLSLVCLVLLGTMPVISNSRPAEVSALFFAVALTLWQVAFAAPAVIFEWRHGARDIFDTVLAPQMRRRTVAVALLTGAMFGLATYLYVLGVEKAGAANAAIAIQAYPLFAILWETLFLKRRKTLLELALTVTMLGALYYLATGGTGQMSGVSPWFLVSLGVPFLWSIAHVLIKEELGRTPITPVQVTFIRVTISAVFLLAVLAALAPADMLAALGTVLLQPMAILMGFVYYVELIVWFYALRHIDVSLASSITTPWPALTLVLAAMILGDPIAAHQIIALVVVVGCIYGLTLASLRKARAA